MFTHNFNVYETLAKLDGLLESGHDEPSPMDRAEYKVLTNTLVQGAAELLSHLAMHDVLSHETAESFEPITPRQISTAAIDSDRGFSDEIVTIALPVHLVPYGAIVESMKMWNVGTIETMADLSVLACLWSRYLNADSDSAEETAILDEWYGQAERIAQSCFPAVQQLDAAGLLRVKDLRTDKDYGVHVVRSGDTPRIELSITTASETARPAQRSTAVRKKSSSRKRSR
jgi:hypothetical protein